MKPFRLALVQMPVKGGAAPENLARAESRIAEAAEKGADVVLLPECLDLGWTHPSSKDQAQPIPEGEPCAKLIAAAREHGVIVCAGLTEQAGEKVFNAAVLIDASGEVLIKHRKINVLDIGLEFYDRGGCLQVAETAFGTMGVMICADAFVEGEVLSRSLAKMGAEMILSPCAWAVEADYDQASEPYGKLWRRVYGKVAATHEITIAGASNVGLIEAGPWEGRLCIGCSLVVDAEGQEQIQGPYGIDADELLFVDVGGE